MIVFVWLTVFLLGWLGSSTFLVSKNNWKFDREGVVFIGLVMFFWPMILVAAILVIILIIVLVVIYGIQFAVKEVRNGRTIY